MKTTTRNMHDGEGVVIADNVSAFKKLRATICNHCPICNHARKNPDSTIGKILHHRYHADHCPLWKACEDVYREK
jgi:hypothetical protein